MYYHCFWNVLLLFYLIPKAYPRHCKKHKLVMQGRANLNLIMHLWVALHLVFYCSDSQKDMLLTNEADEKDWPDRIFNKKQTASIFYWCSLFFIESGWTLRQISLVNKCLKIIFVLFADRDKYFLIEHNPVTVDDFYFVQVDNEWTMHPHELIFG